MKSLKPLTIFAGGSALLAVAVALSVAIAQSDFRNTRGIAICLAGGMVLGMFIFGPIAAPDVFRPDFVRRHFAHFERWSALLMAMGLGHWIGLAAGDAGIVLAFGLVFLGACFRVYLSGFANRPAA